MRASLLNSQERLAELEAGGGVENRPELLRRARPAQRGDPPTARPADRQGRRTRRRPGPAWPMLEARTCGSPTAKPGSRRGSRVCGDSCGVLRLLRGPRGRASRGRAPLLDRHAGLRDARRRAREMLGSVRADLRRLGAVPRRRRLPDPARARDPRRAPQPPTRASGSVPRAATAASSPPPTTPWRWPAASSSPCSTTTTSCTPTPSPRSPGDRPPTPRPTTSTPTRTRSTPSGRHSAPFFKPDWSPERLRTQMYTCHLSVLRRSLVEEVGGFDAEFEGSQDWDLVLKVTERARAVVHVPRVLYHWRDARDLGRRRRRGGEAWAFEAGHARRPGTLRADRVPGRGRARRERPRRLPPEPRLERAAAGQHRDPDRRPGPRGPLRAVGAGRQLRAQHRRALDLRELRDRLRRRPGDRRRRAAASCARSPASACAWSTSTGPSTSRPRSTSARSAARASTC